MPESMKFEFREHEMEFQQGRTILLELSPDIGGRYSAAGRRISNSIGPALRKRIGYRLIFGRHNGFLYELPGKWPHA